MTKVVKITIDGREIEAEEGRNLIDVAREIGVLIPTLCYFKELHPLGTCRICTVKNNGRHAAGCTLRIVDGMKIEVDTPELLDNRKAIIEMLYAEGNHFCPSCEKSGQCDMQNLGYLTGVSKSRFPTAFSTKAVDFNPKRMVMESNRCILCKRCVEEIKTKDGKDVFAFRGRGVKTRVRIDYEQEARLTESEAMRAMRICPVGAILVKGKAGEEPFGHRKYDLVGKDIHPKINREALKKAEGDKFVVATTSLAGCFGCHMSMLDIDLGLIDLLEIVEFNKSPLTDIKEFSKHCHIGLIEGGCANSDNVHVLKEFRRKCDILISVGECAIMGGIPAMRNFIPLRECLEEAYFNSPTSEIAANIMPGNEDIPRLLDRVYTCDEIVRIDYHIPGCPPSAGHIWKFVRSVLLGEEFSISHEQFKYD